MKAFHVQQLLAQLVPIFHTTKRIIKLKLLHQKFIKVIIYSKKKILKEKIFLKMMKKKILLKKYVNILFKKKKI